MEGVYVSNQGINVGKYVGAMKTHAGRTGRFVGVYQDHYHQQLECPHLHKPTGYLQGLLVLYK